MSAGRFPQRIKRGSCVVTIYRTPTIGFDGFTVVHHNASGAQCRRMFTSYAQAHRAAKDTAKELAAGKPEVHVLTGLELVIYRRALRALNGTGVDLDVAVTQLTQATKVLGDVTVNDPRVQTAKTLYADKNVPVTAICQPLKISRPPQTTRPRYRLSRV